MSSSVCSFPTRELPPRLDEQRRCSAAAGRGLRTQAEKKDEHRDEHQADAGEAFPRCETNTKETSLAGEKTKQFVRPNEWRVGLNEILLLLLLFSEPQAQLRGDNADLGAAVHGEGGGPGLVL